MTLLQLVVTKNVLGQYKLAIMGLEPVTGMGATLKTWRGGCLTILWQFIRHLPKLKPYTTEGNP